MSDAQKETNAATPDSGGRTRKPRSRHKKHGDGKAEGKEGLDTKQQKPAVQKPPQKPAASKKDTKSDETPASKRPPRRRAKTESGIDGAIKGSSHGSASEHTSQRPGKPSAATSGASTPITSRRSKPKPAEKPKLKVGDKPKSAGAKKGADKSSEKQVGAAHEKDRQARGGKRKQRAEKQKAQKLKAEDKPGSKPNHVPAKPSKTLFREQAVSGAAAMDTARPKPKPAKARTLLLPAVALPQPVKRAVNTRVCVRLLPADLPEHVFWKSIEPALPWFAPEDAGDVVKVDRFVAYRPEPTEGDASDTEKTGDGEVSKNQPLAPTKTMQVDVYESKNISRLDSEPYWRQYVPGKVHRSKSKPPTASRAYILFASIDEVTHFHQRYHGHVFCKNNVVSRALVELAMSQEIPRDYTPAKDAIEGTIEDDPDFQAFLNPK
ncbi:hypothetical protein EC988_005465, partial [Linderina pennispora]